jgi:hypothetical protein
VLSHDVTFGPSTWIFWHRALRYGGFFIATTFPLILAAALSLRDGRSPLGRWRERSAERAALVMWLGVSVLGTAINGQFLNHYFLQLIPSLSLLAAPVIADIGRGNARTRIWPLAPAASTWLALTAMAFLTVDTIGFIRHRTEGASADYVRDHSTPGDRLFVWGQGDRQTGFYLDAHRRPATRYIATFPLTGHIFGVWDPNYDTSNRIVPGAWNNLEHDFAVHPPRYIIDTDGMEQPALYPISRFPFLRDYLTSYYREVARTRDGVVYERDTPGQFMSARTCKEPRADCPPRTLH